MVALLGGPLTLSDRAARLEKLKKHYFWQTRNVARHLVTWLGFHMLVAKYLMSDDFYRIWPDCLLRIVGIILADQ